MWGRKSPKSRLPWAESPGQKLARRTSASSSFAAENRERFNFIIPRKTAHELSCLGEPVSRISGVVDDDDDEAKTSLFYANVIPIAPPALRRHCAVLSHWVLFHGFDG